MNWKLALAAVAALGLLVSACNKEKKKTPPPAAKAECKLAGDWAMEQLGDDVDENKKRVLTLSFSGKSDGEIASGTLQVGSRDPDPSKFNASASVVDTIESGGSAKVDWVWSGKTNSCDWKFVDECEAIQLKCPEGDTFKITRK